MSTECGHSPTPALSHNPPPLIGLDLHPGPRQLPIGVQFSLLGNYTIKRFIASGGFGSVYCARQESLGRDVAIKTLNSDLPSSLMDLLHREAITAADAAEKIRSDTIVRVYGLEQDDMENWWYVSEFVHDGQPLTEAARDLKEPGADILVGIDWIRQVAEAIGEMHKFEICHLDLTPSNILIKKQSDGIEKQSEGCRIPRIIDFGLSKLTTHDVRYRAGTPGYRSPEQHQPGPSPGKPSDIYSLGALIHTLLVGHEPSGDLPDGGALPAELTKERRALLRRLNRIDDDIAAVCRTCLRHDPRKRYTSAGVLAKDLASWASGDPVSVRPASTLRNIRASAREWWNGLSSSQRTAFRFGAAYAVVFSLAGVWWHGIQAKQEQQRETIRVQDQAFSLAAALSDPQDAHRPMHERIQNWAQGVGLKDDSAKLRDLKVRIAEVFTKVHSPFAETVGLSVFYQDEPPPRRLNAPLDDHSWHRALAKAILLDPNSEPVSVIGRAILAQWLLSDGTLRYLDGRNYGANATSAFSNADTQGTILAKEGKLSPYEIAALHEVSRLLVAEDKSVATDSIEEGAVRPRVMGNVVRAIARGMIACENAAWDGRSLVDAEPENGVLAAYAAQMCGLSPERRWQWVQRMASATRWEDPYTDAYFALLPALGSGLAPTQQHASTQVRNGTSSRMTKRAGVPLSMGARGWRTDHLQHVVSDLALIQGIALWHSEHPWGSTAASGAFAMLCTPLAEQPMGPDRAMCQNIAQKILSSSSAPAWLKVEASLVAIRFDPESPLANLGRQALARDLQVRHRWAETVRPGLLLNPEDTASFVSHAGRVGWNAAVISRSENWGHSTPDVSDIDRLRVCDEELGKRPEKGADYPWDQCALRVLPMIRVSYEYAYG